MVKPGGSFSGGDMHCRPDLAFHLEGRMIWAAENLHGGRFSDGLVPPTNRSDGSGAIAVRSRSK